MKQETAIAPSVVGTINETLRENKVTQLAPNRVLLAEHARNTWHATPEAGTPPDALLDPKYWAHYAVNHSVLIKPEDHIHAYPEDGAYFVELIVRDISRGGVRVRELRRVLFDKDEPSGETIDDHEIKYSGPSLKWTVIRRSDKRRLSDGHAEKRLAEDWLRENRKAHAA